MSSSSITEPRSLVGTVDIESLLWVVLYPIKRLAFWTAIVLPFLHLSLLATGLDSRSKVLAFSALVGLNVCALVVASPTRSSSPRPTRVRCRGHTVIRSFMSIQPDVTPDSARTVHRLCHAPNNGIWDGMA